MLEQILTSLSDEKLTQKIENIKAERERTEKALKQYEDELKRRKNAKLIDIKVLLPLLKKGKVFYDPCMEEWFWAKKNATVTQGENTWIVRGIVCRLTPFNLKLSVDWRNSLMECGS